MRKIIWMCGACGRFAEKREAVGDESCYLHSVQVWEDSLTGVKGRMAKGATAVPKAQQMEE